MGEEVRRVKRELAYKGTVLNVYKDYMETLYLIFDYPYKYYTFKHFEV